jgi:hypothetical protein
MTLKDLPAILLGAGLAWAPVMWLGDNATAQDCATKGRAALFSGQVITCQVEVKKGKP